MAAKWFIVEPGNERLFATLHAALANESDVEILYDRRRRGMRGAHWHGPERRVAQDVRDRIRADGFAVVRPAPPPPPARNLRWA